MAARKRVLGRAGKITKSGHRKQPPMVGKNPMARGGNCKKY